MSADQTGRGRCGVRTAGRAGDVFLSRAAGPPARPGPLPAGHAAGPMSGFKPRCRREPLMREPCTQVSCPPGAQCLPSARPSSRLLLSVGGRDVVGMGSARDKGHFRDRAACVLSCLGKSSRCHPSHQAPHPWASKGFSPLCWAAFHKVPALPRSGPRGRDASEVSAPSSPRGSGARTLFIGS